DGRLDHLHIEREPDRRLVTASSIDDDSRQRREGDGDESAPGGCARGACDRGELYGQGLTARRGSEGVAEETHGEIQLTVCWLLAVSAGCWLTLAASRQSPVASRQSPVASRQSPSICGTRSTTRSTRLFSRRW